MPYDFKQGESGSPIAIAGYFFVQPFTFQNGLLQRNPSSARLVVTLALTGHNDDSYPSKSAGLEPEGQITIGDRAEDTILTAEGFETTSIVPSQSRDLALTHWIFQGSEESAFTFTPNDTQRQAQRGRVYGEGRVRWYGHASSDDPQPKRLNLTYLAMPISFGQNRDLDTADLIGIANVEGSGSLAAWLLDQQVNAHLGLVTVTDVLRNTTTKIAGDGGPARIQMSEAFGAAYVMNGIYTKQPAATVAAFARRFDGGSANVIRDAARDGTGVFSGLTQPLSETPDGTGKDPDDYQINGPDFEGLSFWNLQPRQGSDAAQLY
ncbi:hypothetical protein [Roseibium aggregatum]|uniref:hypothetical protein n=1 Tax=Roseibium aggregatum TaxID=187304 RepID=UPI00094AB784|nr:hypothetical protein [Roseibium aggregatum]UFI04657.1 hypothetical protein ST40_005865 [Roseibium aggregatum]